MIVALDERRTGHGYVIACGGEVWTLIGSLEPIRPWLRSAALVIAGLGIAPQLEADGVPVMRYGARQTDAAPTVDHPDPDAAKVLGWCLLAARKRPLIW